MVMGIENNTVLIILAIYQSSVSVLSSVLCSYQLPKRYQYMWVSYKLLLTYFNLDSNECAYKNSESMNGTYYNL